MIAFWFYIFNRPIMIFLWLLISCLPMATGLNGHKFAVSYTVSNFISKDSGDSTISDVKFLCFSFQLINSRPSITAFSLSTTPISVTQTFSRDYRPAVSNQQSPLSHHTSQASIASIYQSHKCSREIVSNFRTPSIYPSTVPILPSMFPTQSPFPSTLLPTIAAETTDLPTSPSPSQFPTHGPGSPNSSDIPTHAPTIVFVGAPTIAPSVKTFLVPTNIPSPVWTTCPSIMPSTTPSTFPTCTPSIIPQGVPVHLPTHNPTSLPSAMPSRFPSAMPTRIPSIMPTAIPSSIPTAIPSIVPAITLNPIQPSNWPTLQPTFLFTNAPVTNVPSSYPTIKSATAPSSSPTSTPISIYTSIPTSAPSIILTSFPTSAPTATPSGIPTSIPTSFPSNLPTSFPTDILTNAPTNFPTNAATIMPSTISTSVPTNYPSNVPSSFPTRTPSPERTIFPTIIPTTSDTNAFSVEPTSVPTSIPSASVDELISSVPTSIPSNVPVISTPTLSPVRAPSSKPSPKPSTYSTVTLQPTMPVQVAFIAQQKLAGVSLSTFSGPNRDRAIDSFTFSVVVIINCTCIAQADINVLDISSSKRRFLRYEQFFQFQTQNSYNLGMSSSEDGVFIKYSITTTAAIGFSGPNEAVNQFIGNINDAIASGRFTSTLINKAEANGLTDFRNATSSPIETFVALVPTAMPSRMPTVAPTPIRLYSIAEPDKNVGTLIVIITGPIFLVTILYITVMRCRGNLGRPHHPEQICDSVELSDIDVSFTHKQRSNSANAQSTYADNRRHSQLECGVVPPNPFRRFRPHRFREAFVGKLPPGRYEISKPSPIFDYLLHYSTCSGGKWSFSSDEQRSILSFVVSNEPSYKLSGLRGFMMTSVEIVVSSSEIYQVYERYRRNSVTPRSRASKQRTRTIRAINDDAILQQDMPIEWSLSKKQALKLLSTVYHKRGVQNQSNVVNSFYAYIGCSLEELEEYCHRGIPTKSGRFGIGCYCTLNIEFAARKARGDFDDTDSVRKERGRLPVLLVAVSVKCVYPITTDIDFQTVRGRQRVCLFESAPLQPGHDAHVVHLKEVDTMKGNLRPVRDNRIYHKPMEVTDTHLCQYTEVIVAHGHQIVPLAVLWLQEKKKKEAF